ncbi:MAG: tRNA (adenosine(37)-N6)-threonylcarbamoyltransferase complex dimerization subunit type 1 TsaB [Pseudomonadota bacterium]
MENTLGFTDGRSVSLMNILALETSTEYLSVALANEEKIVALDCLAEQKHSELILPMVENVLADAAIERSGISAIAFSAGPGSFTGLRIACGVAQGLAYGLGVPVIPISTLEAVAEASGKNKVIVALDARMGEIYYAGYERQAAGWKVVIEAGLCKPENAPVLIGRDWFAAGSGFAIYEKVLSARYTDQIVGMDGSLYPHARVVVRLAMERYLQGLMVDAAEAAPIYIRNKVALTIQEQVKSS